jgi:2-oxoisovalerate dehydrogenase E1 component
LPALRSVEEKATEFTWAAERPAIGATGRRRLLRHHGRVSAPHDDLDHGVRGALGGLTAAVGSAALARFEVMAASRHLDLQARRMRARGQGHYTIGSAGHESNALVAAAARVGDPALLHYRSGAFYLERSRQAERPLADGVRDVLASMMGAVIDPASGGRHKVFGNPALSIIPQTSTIASQLPRAVGVAFAIERAGALGLPTRWAPDSIAVTSFGDASLNHSTAVGALNAAGHFVQSGFGLPILFVCEDNGLGISVSSPEHWVEQAARRPGVRYAYADGDDPDAVLKVAHDLVDEIRTTRRPGLLHLRTVRFLGHAGTDVESTYRSPADLRADLERDPIVALARSASASPGSIDLARRYDEVGVLVAGLADELIGARTLTSRAAVMAPLTIVGKGAPRTPTPAPAPAPAPAPSVTARDSAQSVVTRDAAPSVVNRDAAFGGRRPEDAGELTLAQTINAALTDAMAARPEMLVFGEDVGRKGGVYGITRALAQRFGVARVFDTLLDEQTILGLALGLGLRSSTWPTCTTLRTSSGARRPACASSPTPPTRTRWSCAWPAWLIRRASAAISTTTTRSRCCATSPVCSWPFPPTPTTRPLCCGPASMRPSPTDGWPSTWNRSRCTTSAICTTPAIAGGWRPTPPPARLRWDAGESTATGPI